jgi:hypothetical protein
MPYFGSTADGILPNVTYPNSYDNLDIDSTTDLSGIPDYTAQVQAAVNLVQSTLGGGPVLLPPGLIRINNLQVTGDGVWIKGYGAGSTPIPSFGVTKRSKYGTYILHDNPNSAIVVTASATNFRLSDCSFIEAQTPEGPGFSPIVFPPPVLLQGGGDTITYIERCLFWQTYKAIQCGRAPGFGVGTIIFRDINYATFAPASAGGGIRLFGTTASSFYADDILLDNVRFDPIHLLRNSNQQAYILTNSAALVIDSSTWAVRVNNSTFKSAAVGIGIDNNGFVAPSSVGFEVADTNFQGCLKAIYENGNGIALYLNNFLVNGAGATPASTAISSVGISPNIFLNNGFLENFSDYAIYCNPSNGIGTYQLAPNVIVYNWNQNTLGNPALYLANLAGAYLYFSQGNRFISGGVAPFLGGGGNFVCYDNSSYGTENYQTPVTGFTINASGNNFSLILNPAGTLAMGTVGLPIASQDGQRFKIFSTQTVTSLTINAQGGQSVVTTAGSIVSGTGLEFQYVKAANTWYG